MIRPYKGQRPRLGEGVYVDPSAQVIGDVTLGDHVSIWPCATIRGDVHSITVGAFSNIQDNSVIHVMAPDFPTTVGHHVTVGHSVNLHGCTVEDYCLIGIGAIVLNGSTVGTESIVAAGALVAEGMEIPPGVMAMGSPARVLRSLTRAEKAALREYAQNYFEYKNTYLEEQNAH
jgi:carbonic anhydrase/acetyltransferase-like protein (isoleucine patch superfamily)